MVLDVVQSYLAVKQCKVMLLGWNCLSWNGSAQEDVSGVSSLWLGWSTNRTSACLEVDRGDSRTDAAFELVTHPHS